MIAVYIRTSSDTQITASQDAEIGKWLDRESISDARRYVDESETGKKMNRPMMNALLDELQSGDKIVIWRMDRLGRTAAGVTTLLNILIEKGVTLVSLRDGFDLSTPSGRLMANVLASVAQFETEVRRERQAAGIAEAKKRGVYRGRCPGYPPQMVRRAKFMRANKFTFREIAKALGVSMSMAEKYVKRKTKQELTQEKSECSQTSEPESMQNSEPESANLPCIPPPV